MCSQMILIGRSSWSWSTLRSEMKYSDVILIPDLGKQLYLEHPKTPSEMFLFDPDPKL